MAEREREPITEANVLRSSRSTRLLITSMRGAFLQGEGASGEDQVERIMNAMANHDFFSTPETLALIRAVDPARLSREPQALVRLLHEFRIELEQLDFTERVLGLEAVQVVALLPEGRRAYFPLAGKAFGLGALAGEELPVDWNRLYLYGNISPEFATPEAQQDYLQAQLGVESDHASLLNNGESFISFRGSEVAVHPGGAIYLLLQSGNFPRPSGEQSQN